ncbi:transcriptional regulator [Novosphingobium barchaimii LL02]|uniref:Transcriptional regulator n=1 Tax=Novosphingobium barchaimii LL02 TaxID=1114963 RepID=A0A0J7Y6C7_9SPHN|nr:TetR/AcrR family transcriptional regulator [Novosphingobium barchaimii]KMS58918.1 transcriptional regulator [Novosphingobium barchaimii LL02]
MPTTYPPLFALPEIPAGTSGDAADRTLVLIRAAYDLLDEAGLEGLTIRAVLARAGLARRAFYERFQGKDDLVLAVFDQSLRAAALQFREITARCAGPVEALQAIVTGIVVGQLGQDRMGANRRGAALSREHLRLAQTRPSELNSALEPLLDVMAGHVALGMGQGVFRAADSQLQARLIYNLVSTTVHTVLLAEEGGAADPAEREGLAEDLWEFCRRAIQA